MNRKTIGTMAGIATSLLLALPASANLLVNSGFEDPVVPVGGDAPGAAGWNSFNDVFTASGLLAGPAGANSGDQVLKMFGVAGVFQDFAASEGQTWDGGAFVLNSSADALAGGQVAAVNIEWLDSGGNQISFISNGSTTALTPEDQWILQTVSGVAPAGTAFARFILITGDFLPGGGGGAPFYDDAFFDLRPVPVPAALWLMGSGLLGLVGLRRKRA